MPVDRVSGSGTPLLLYFLFCPFATRLLYDAISSLSSIFIVYHSVIASVLSCSKCPLHFVVTNFLSILSNSSGSSLLSLMYSTSAPKMVFKGMEHIDLITWNTVSLSALCLIRLLLMALSVSLCTARIIFLSSAPSSSFVQAANAALLRISLGNVLYPVGSHPTLIGSGQMVCKSG